MSEEKSNGIVKHNGSQRLGLGPTRPRQEASDSNEARLDLSELWEPIRRGKWIILITSVLVIGAVVGYTMTLPAVYQTDSIVSIEGGDNAQASVVAFGGGEGRDLGREIGTLEYSGELRRRVAERLLSTSQSLVREDSVDAPLPIVQGDSAGDLADPSEIAARLDGRVSFGAAQRDARMLSISSTSQLPIEATIIANTYAEEYQKFARESSRASITAARRFLEDQVAKRKEEIRQLEQEWESFARNNEVVTLGQDGNRLVQEYTSLSAQKRDLEFQLERQQANLQILRDRLADLEPRLSEKVEAEQSINSLRTQIQALDDRIAELKAEAEPYYVNNPDLRGNEEQIPELAEIQRQIEGYQNRKQELTTELVARASESEDAVGEGSALGEIGALRERIEEQQLEIQQTRDEIRQLENQMSTYEGRLDRIPSQTINRQQLERRLAQAEDFYLRVADELRRTIIREESELGYVTQVRNASVPGVPISPDYQQNILLGILLGLGLGVGLAFVRHAMNQRLKDPEDIQESGYSLVGVIPRMDREVKATFDGKDAVEVNGKQISTRLMPLHEPWSPISENYRLVRTNLQYSVSGNAPKVLLMTSPQPADGKTLTAVNVALSMAQSGRRTLLVDLDLRRPTTHKLLGYDRGPGISEVLEGKNSMDEVLVATDLDNLDYISAGDISSPPPEALESNSMKRLVAEFRDSYDVVIIDSPPVLAATDPVILAPLCDATLLIVSAEDTDLRALQTTERTLETVGVNIAGVIFNRYDPSEDGSYAGQYRYGHYAYDYSE